jgi:hypothetical protein
MAKKIFVFLTLAVIITLVAMALTKPEAWQHYGEVRSLAMKVASQEAAKMQLPAELPEEYAKVGEEVVMDAAGSFIQSNMQVDDYVVLSVGIVNFRGQSLPITIGAFGKVFVLVDEEDIRRAIK